MTVLLLITTSSLLAVLQQPIAATPLRSNTRSTDAIIKGEHNGVDGRTEWYKNDDRNRRGPKNMRRRTEQEHYDLHDDNDIMNMNKNKYVVMEDEDSMERHNTLGIFGQQLFTSNGYPAYLNEEYETVPFTFPSSSHGYGTHDRGGGRSDRRTLKEGATETEEREKKKYHHHKDHTITYMEELRQMQDQQENDEDEGENDPEEVEKERAKLLRLRERPGIRANTVHAMMIDAGSTGSRLHVYEFAPRILEDRHQVDGAVSGNRLSFPGTESRWTERLRPGINAFATIKDDAELHDALKEYLTPLMQFAMTVLHSKQGYYGLYPIYLKATGGMRTLSPSDRQRLMRTVRNLFADNEFCPFWFEPEFARVISGEEEAIYGWAGVNFLMGTLLEYSEGSGTVMSPALTYGSLDLGGASTQIAFYDPNEDIMSNLFKLQIGAAKHWNVYTHSFLMFGANAAYDRLNARLYFNTTLDQLEDQRGVYNPCLPHNAKTTFTSKIQVDPITGMSRWPPQTMMNDSSTVGMYTTLIRNDNVTDDVLILNDTSSDKHGKNAMDETMDDASKCVELATKLLNKPTSNQWCYFEHKGDCSFAGVYQPPLPLQNERFGEFLGFSNFHHVFDFLEIPDRSNMQQLRDGVTRICNMNLSELQAFNAQKKPKRQVTDEDLMQYCFRASYVFAILHHGYGFDMDKYITAKHKIQGHKVTWAIGSVMYEINTLPWQYERDETQVAPKRHRIRSFIQRHLGGQNAGFFVTFGFIVLILFSIQIMCIKSKSSSRRRMQRRRNEYDEILALKNNNNNHQEGNDDETLPMLQSSSGSSVLTSTANNLSGPPTIVTGMNGNGVVNADQGISINTTPRVTHHNVAWSADTKGGAEPTMFSKESKKMNGHAQEANTYQSI